MERKKRRKKRATSEEEPIQAAGEEEKKEKAGGLMESLRKQAAERKAKARKKDLNEEERGYELTKFSIAMAMRNTHFGWSPWMAYVRHPDNPCLRVPGPEHGIRHEIDDKDTPKLEPVVVILEKKKRLKRR